MKKRLSMIFAVFTVILVALTLFGCNEDIAAPLSNASDITVSIRECEGVKVTSEAVKTVRSGKDVFFEIDIDDNYIYMSNTAGATFNEHNGRLTLYGVTYPTTIDVLVIPKSDMLMLNIQKNDTDGFVKITEGEQYMTSAGAVTVSATSFGGVMFSGWSEGDFIHNGGILVSTEPQYTFYMNKNTTLYANFVNRTEYTIIYHMNGGKVAETGEDTYEVKGKFTEMFTMQQTLQHENFFVRSGYVAIGYSTEPVLYEEYSSVNDIPGFSNMGGVCHVKDASTLDLYVVWAKATDPSKFTVNNGTITGYRGSDKIIVIPENISGVEIRGVDPNAFSGSIERVVLPRTITKVAQNAFKGCSSLREVIFFDSITEIYDASFTGCNIKTICLNAQRLPKYSGTAEGSFCIKYERVRTATQPIIAIVSGSSTLNGLISPTMEKNFPGYTIVNYGTNASNPSMFYLEVISNYTKEGDIIIHAPEFTSGNPMGNNQIVPKLFRANEQCYDIFREVDMTRYTNFFDSWRKFLNGDPNDSSLTPALNLGSKPYQNVNTGMNMYGDLANNRPGPTKDSFGGATTSFNYNALNYKNLNLVNKMITEKGGTLLMSFGTFDLSRMNPSKANQAEYDKFTADCQSKLDYPVISNVGTYIMDHSLFHNSEWHCSYAGAEIRTENITADLRRYLASVGKE